MKVVRYSSFQKLQGQAVAWDRLAAGVPFRSWAWLATWWQHYKELGQLYVLGVFERGELVGLAPWYLTNTRQHGQTLRFLGDVEVCSEYASILCNPGSEQAVAKSLADWLSQAGDDERWDVIELTPTDPEDPTTSVLAELMAGRGCRLHSQAGPGCWRVLLPTTWDAYLQSLSKNRRKQLRRMQRRYLDSGLAVWHTARTSKDLAVAQRILVDLHQRRRNTLGEPGCFAWPRYRSFHEDVLPRLLHTSQLGLHWVELEGRAVAAEYQLIGTEVVYCYQGGIAPDDTTHSPGQIATLFTFQNAIERGYSAVDFLRGDETYKQHWQAEHRPNIERRIVADRKAAQLRHGIWATGLDVKGWMKGAMEAMHLR